MTPTSTSPSTATATATRGRARGLLPPTWRHALAWFALFTAIGLLNALHFYLSQSDSTQPMLLRVLMVEELTGSWSAGILMPFVVRTARAIRPETWALQAPSHVAALLAFSATHTTLIATSRLVGFPLAGLGPSWYGFSLYRAEMEFPSDVIVYALFVCGTWLVDQFRLSRERELRASRLESALAEARLEALRLQLNPHFLFNALNAVSEAMYERPRAADEMLARIGELLRATLAAQSQEHALADELRLLDLYVAIQRARFGEPLRVDVAVAPGLGLERVRVPFLVLQPLVENAVEHGADAFGRCIAVRATARDGRLELEVRDGGGSAGDTASTSSGHTGHGIGLANLRARLAHLHGDKAGLALEPVAAADGGGTRVRLWLPLAGERTT